MSKIFESLRMRKPGYSAFDLSHEKKLTFEMAQLIPILHEEILPGDHFKINTEVFLRFAPMIAPIMHRVNVYVHFFFVPNRIIWDSWEDFITGGQLGLTSPSMPTVTYTSQLGISTLADYLGIGGTVAGSVYQPEINALAFRAYQSIFNEYYRDETLDPLIDFTIEGEVVQLRTRRWEKDYFTSALPWTQRGTEIGVPITFDAGIGSGAGGTKAWDVVAAPPELSDTGTPNLDVDTSGNVVGADSGAGRKITALDNTDSLNLTINDLRQSSRLQEWLEKNARGGYRYIEQLLSHFGVKSSDSRLQRPEYIGGGRQPVTISEVLNTSATATEEQGTMAGHGIAVGTANSMKRRFEEHGQLLGIMSVIPRTSYMQGIPRKFLRLDKLDYYFPEFAHLGEQVVESREVYMHTGGSQADNEAVFGYQQRFGEYKYGYSCVHGDFRGNLDFWHMARIFTSRPVLGATFVRADPTERIFAVLTDDHMWCQVYNNVKARRPMPYFANPKL